MYTYRTATSENVAAFVAEKGMHATGTGEVNGKPHARYTGEKWQGLVTRDESGKGWIVRYHEKTQRDLDAALPGKVIGAMNVPGRGAFAPGRIVLVQREGKYDPYVTWFQNAQTNAACSGHYFDSLADAMRDFAARCEREAACQE